jgi:transcriptional regulator with XRE-family HTH domain
MAKTILKRDDVVALLQKRQGDRTQIQFCAEVGCSQSYLSEIYRGTRDPGQLILQWLGLEETETTYVRR